MTVNPMTVTLSPFQARRIHATEFGAMTPYVLPGPAAIFVLDVYS